VPYNECGNIVWVQVVGGACVCIAPLIVGSVEATARVCIIR
jgi:hypothetical protein